MAQAARRADTPIDPVEDFEPCRDERCKRISVHPAGDGCHLGRRPNKRACVAIERMTGTTIPKVK